MRAEENVTLFFENIIYASSPFLLLPLPVELTMDSYCFKAFFAAVIFYGVTVSDADSNVVLRDIIQP